MSSVNTAPRLLNRSSAVDKLIHPILPRRLQSKSNTYWPNINQSVINRLNIDRVHNQYYYFSHGLIPLT